jgi:hypothetical protein
MIDKATGLCRSIIKVKVKESRNRSAVAQRIPGGSGSQIPCNSVHEVGEVVILTQRPPLPPGNIRGTHLNYGLSRPQGHGTVGRKYVIEKSSNTTGNRSRDRPTSSKCLNHYATLGPHWSITICDKIYFKLGHFVVLLH